MYVNHVVTVVVAVIVVAVVVVDGFIYDVC